jgi:small subunit ribosomal protein S1
VPGKVTKLVPFGAFVRVDEGIEGLVHISELAERHVEIPSRSCRSATRSWSRSSTSTSTGAGSRCRSSRPTRASSATRSSSTPPPTAWPPSYDDQGNYIYPEGFDPETGEWLEGYDEARETWERQYAEAQARFEAHRKQIAAAREADAEAAAGATTPRVVRSPATGGDTTSGGTLASDEALAALRAKLAGGE